MHRVQHLTVALAVAAAPLAAQAQSEVRPLGDIALTPDGTTVAWIGSWFCRQLLPPE